MVIRTQDSEIITEGRINHANDVLDILVKFNPEVREAVEICKSKLLSLARRVETQAKVSRRDSCRFLAQKLGMPEQRLGHKERKDPAGVSTSRSPRQLKLLKGGHRERQTKL